MPFKVISQVKSNMKSLVTKDMKLLFINLKLKSSFNQTPQNLF